MKHRLMMMALFVVALSQTTFASLKPNDPNMPGTAAAAAKRAADKGGAYCPFATKGNANVLPPSNKLSLASSSAPRNGLPVHENKHKQ